MNPAMRRKILLTAALVGLALRGLYAWRQYARVYVPIDGYEILACGLLERGELSLEPGKPTSVREPGYPIMIAGLYAAAGGRHAWVVLVAQILMSLAIAAMLASMGMDLFGADVGAAAFCAYMLYPQSIYYCASTFRDTLAAFVFAAAVWAVSRAGRLSAWPAVGWALASGAASGVLAVTSTAGALGLVPACAAALLWMGRRRLLAPYFIPILVFAGAWTVRNWGVHGGLILGSTSGGGEIYQAMIIEPDDLGTPRQSEILAHDAFWIEAARLPEAERNSALIRRTLELVRERPLLYARRVCVRVVKMWRLWPYRRSYDEPYRGILLASLLSDGWMVPVGLFGFFRLRKRWNSAPAAPFSVLGLTVVYGLLHSVIRYRFPAMAFVILSAVATLEALLRRSPAA